MTVPGKHEAGATDWSPHPKVWSGGIGGALTTIAIWGIGLTGVDIPPAIAAAIATVIYAVVAYRVPSPSA